MVFSTMRANPDQANFDGDEEGDLCDPDDDNDGVLDEDDCEPFNDQVGEATTVYYADFDGDGFGDPNDSQIACSQPADFVTDGTDNCPDVANPDQADLNNDGIGDACDDDGGTNIFWLEAECAEVGSGWVVQSDEEASNDEYVVRLGSNAVISPPDDLPENHIRFSLQDVAAGNYHLFGLVSAFNTADDSFWVRINNGPWLRWWQGIIIGGEFNWNAVTNGPFPLTEGDNVIDFAYRENGAKLDKIHLNLTGTLPSGSGSVATNCELVDNFAVAFEAECAETGGWVTRNSASASGGQYLVFVGPKTTTTPTVNIPFQQITTTVDLAETADYHLFIRMDAPDQASNSCWVRIDDGPWLKMWKENDGSQLSTVGFEWKKVNEDGNFFAFNLVAGTHTIRIANRESGTRIDKFYISRFPDVPTGFGAEATNCEEALVVAPGSGSVRTPSLKATLSIDDENRIVVFPNPAQNELNMRLNSPYKGQVRIEIIDVNGRSLQRLTYQKAADLLTARLSVSNLPSGTYYLRVIQEDQQVLQPFVKLPGW